MNLTWIHMTAHDLATERRQAEDEGRDLSGMAERFDALAHADFSLVETQERLGQLLDDVQRLPYRADCPYDEPSDLAGIRDRRRKAPALGPMPSDSALADRMYGAWLGRCCGCLLGKPVEGWRRPKMNGYLRDLGRWPLDRYFTAKVPAEIIERYELQPSDEAFIENVKAMPEDDDTNYTVTGLAILRDRGPAFTPEDVAMFWLRNIPVGHVCTAERVAYANFLKWKAPPESAAYRNPYREWIGAQIRADGFGYAAAGKPELAAEFGWRDACISHVRNGIYGEMWAAATIAAAFVTDDPRTAVLAGLAQVPEKSRFVECLDRVIGWADAGVSYDDACEKLHAEWDENTDYGWCHTIPNAMLVAIGLLWGEGDFALSICRAVQPCLDTDCNGATVGSVSGAIVGASGGPHEWTGPLNDTLITGVTGYHRVSIRDMAEKTIALVKAQ